MKRRSRAFGAARRILVVAAFGSMAGGLVAGPASAAGGAVKLTLAVTPPTDHFLLSASPTATAGMAFSLAVTAQDRWNNTTPGYRGTIHFTSGDPAAVLPADYTFTTGTGADNGSHWFALTLITAGLQAVRAVDTANNAISGATSVTVVAGPASRLLLSAPAGVIQGTSFSVTVSAQDAFGNVASGYRGTVTFTSSDVRAVLPPPYGFNAVDGGVHLFSVILRTVGSQSLKIADNSTPVLTAAVTILVNKVTLQSTPVSIVATEGAGFNGPVAKFTDPVLTDSPSSYAATISWGDGGHSAGTISVATATIVVAGSHTYAEEGKYPVSVQLTDADGSTGSATNPAAVSDAPLSSAGAKLNAIEGSAFTKTVATFVDADPNGKASDYVAAISWGDLQFSPGTISPKSGGGFIVTGTHNYADEGTYLVVVIVADVGSATLANSTVTVTES